jgi:hypothetical protein
MPSPFQESVGSSLKASKTLLFLKKKKQKDFYPLALCLAGSDPAQTNKSFFVLFFKKGHLPF